MRTKTVFTTFIFILAASVAFAGGTVETADSPPGDDNKSERRLPDNPGQSMGETVIIKEPGVLVMGIIMDGPAAEAGIRRGDIILSIDDKAVNSLQEIRMVLSDYHGGDNVLIGLKRGDSELSIKLRLDDRLYHPPLGLMVAPESHPEDDRRRWDGNPDRRGTVSSEYTRGAFIAEVREGSPAAEAGLQWGDVITAVNGKDLNDEDLKGLIASLKPGDTIVLKVFRLSALANGVLPGPGKMPGDGDADILDIEVMLGETDEGKTYLGISFIPTPGLPGYGNSDIPWRPMPHPGIPLPELRDRDCPDFSS